VYGVADALWRELREISFEGTRARFSTSAALAVMASVLIAQALHLDEVWWAGLTGFMATQATRPAAIGRGALRIAGAAIGAATSFVMAPWFAYDHVAGSLFIFGFATLGALAAQVSPRGYAWLSFGMTFNLIVMSSLPNPLLAVNYAFYRVVEVTIGTVVAMLIATVLAPDDAAPAAPAPPGWRDLLGENWPAVLHAFRTGITVMLLPLIWSWLDLPSLSQMAITVAAVMAVPTLSADPSETARAVIQRAAYRLIGCFLGGATALIFIALPLTEFLPWLGALGAGVWISCYIQTSERGVGNIGTQAAIVLIITLVQGWAPPTSILPGIDRFAGMAVGLTILLVVTMLIWPDPEPGAPSSAR
jgi:uncharacterized membrane protein YccC